MQSRKQEVIDFLEDLKIIIEGQDFDIDKNFIFINSKKEDDEFHSNRYTVLNLGYSIEDVVDRLKELTVQEYSETKIDNADVNSPILYVFGKEIDRKLVYIKIKIKGDQIRKILCLSFHYAKNRMIFPYA